MENTIEGIGTMTQDTKKTIYWTAGSMAVLIAIVAVLWVMGIFAPPGAQ